MDLTSFLYNHPKTHLIFDFGNTLFFHEFKWGQLMDKFNQTIEDISSDVLSRYQTDISAMMNVITDSYGPDVKHGLDRIWSDFEIAQIDQIMPNQKLINFIENNINKYQFYIWSSNSKALIEAVLQDFNIHHHFSKIISREDVLHLKPNPEGFSLISDLNQSKPSQYLFIGDSHHDETAAKLINIDFYQIGDQLDPV